MPITKFFRWVKSSTGLKDLTWLLTGSAVSLPLGLICTVLLARIFTQTETGSYFFMLSLMAALAGFGLPGVSSIIISCVARNEGGSFRKAVRWELMGGLAGGVCLLVLCSTVKIPEAIPRWVVIALSFLFPLYICDCGWHALTGKRKYKQSAMFQIGNKMFLMTGLVAAYIIKAPISLYLLWVVLITGSINTWLFMRQWSSIGSPELCDNKSLLYGLNLTVSNLLQQPMGQAERIIVGIWYGPQQLAVFVLGEMVYGYLKIIGNYTHNIYFPRVSKMDDKEVGRYLFKQALLWTGVFLAVGTALFIVFPLVYPVIFGEQYRESSFFAGIYGLVFALGVPSYFLTIYFRHMRATRETYIFGLARTPIQIAAIVPCFILMGITGLPLSRLLTNSAHSFLGWGLALKKQRRLFADA